MTDVPIERGCLAVMPRSHRKETTIHCPGKTSDFDNSIPDQILGTPEGEQEPKLLPVKKGGAVLFTQYTEHGGMPNLTDKLRWSFDLRFNPAGQSSGREIFPGFLARSSVNPDSVLQNATAYKQLWDEARAKISRELYQKPIYDNSRWDKYRASEVCSFVGYEETEPV